MARRSRLISNCDHTFAMTSPTSVSSKPRLVPCTTTPLSGLWCPETHLKGLFYGPGCVQSHLRSMLPSAGSRVFIITGTSLYNKTSLIQELEQLLGDSHAGTFAGIKQHGHFADVDAAFDQLRTASLQHPVDTIISVGGGSPIDSAKTLSYWTQQASGKFLAHISIPTTLSAAECTAGGGYTNNDGVKVGFMCPGCKYTSLRHLFTDYGAVRAECVKCTTTEKKIETILQRIQPTNTDVQWASWPFSMTRTLPGTHPHACSFPQAYVLWTTLWRPSTTPTRPRFHGRHWPLPPSRLCLSACPLWPSHRNQPMWMILTVSYH